MAATPKVLLDGLIFPEGPRWHDGALYFSDMHGCVVWRLTPEGKGRIVLPPPFGEGPASVSSHVLRQRPAAAIHSEDHRTLLALDACRSSDNRLGFTN